MVRGVSRAQLIFSSNGGSERKRITTMVCGAKKSCCVAANKLPECAGVCKASGVLLERVGGKGDRVVVGGCK